MNIQEIDKMVWDMSDFEKANILHYLIGYAKSNEKLRNELVDAINKRNTIGKKGEAST